MVAVKNPSRLFHSFNLPSEINSDLTGEGDLLSLPPPLDLIYFHPHSVSRNPFNIFDGHAHRTMSAIIAAHPMISNIAIGFIRMVHFQVLDR